MSLLLYGIAENRPGPPACPAAVFGEGVDARPLRRIARAGLGALVSEHDSAPELDEETLWAFERALEAEMAEGAVLPVRFGTLLEDEAAVERVLGERREELLMGLDRVRSAVELSVRAFWSQENSSGGAYPTGEAARSGKTYMLARVGAERRARALAERLHAALDELARATHYQVGTETGGLTAAFLVDRDRVEVFSQRVQALGDAIENAELTCTGPWPPYSFVGGDGRG